MPDEKRQNDMRLSPSTPEHRADSTIARSCAGTGLASSPLGNIGGFIYLTTACLSGLVGLAAFVFWIICIVNAAQNKYYKLPIIGDYAEKFVDKNPAGAPLTF